MRFNLKRVVGVGQQVGHCHRGVVEARRSGQKADIAAARLTTLCPATAAISSDATAAFAEDSEGDVPASAAVLWPAPV